MQRMLVLTLGWVLWSCGDDVAVDMPVDGGGRDSAVAAAGVQADGGVAAPAELTCPYAGDPLVDPTSFPTCDLCEDAHCVPAGVLDDSQAQLLADCHDGAKCVPDELIESLGTSVGAPCRSIGGAEGRCTSRCIPAVADMSAVLPQEGCGTGEACAPCFDPITGEDTGACSLMCDDGAQEPPFLFEECCSDLSVCVPADLVPADQRSLLDAAGCDGGDDLCAPKTLAVGSVPVKCAGLSEAEGRCLPACLPGVAPLAELLVQGRCLEGELCVPCHDPRSGEVTGACHIGDDEPVQPQFEFPACCDDGAEGHLGQCVPEELVPPDQLKNVDNMGCSGGELCAPASIVKGTYEPEVCVSWLLSEGRCQPICLPEVNFKQERLAKDICGQGQLCVPCFDPTDLRDTGACFVEGDKPMAETPVSFPKCCNTAGVMRGTCIPRVAAGARGAGAPVLDCESLTGDADDYVCVPDELIPVPPGSFPTCTTTYVCSSDATTCGLESSAITGQEGVCAPACMLAEQGDTPFGNAVVDVYGQGTCEAGEKCAPCLDPTTGDPTGLCD